VGYINGLPVARVGVPSFMATLATQFFWSGMVTGLRRQVRAFARGKEGWSGDSWWAGQAARGSLARLNDVSVQGFDRPHVIALWFILNRHRFGEHVLFIGDSMPCRGSWA
jgi:simple sugar transport system permease protein